MTYTKGKLMHSDGSPCREWDCAWRNDGGHHVVNKIEIEVGRARIEMMTPTEYWKHHLDEATERAVTAAEDSVKAAVLLLAYGARECLPKAARIYLSESDQGEWLWVDDIDGIDQSDESQPVLQGSFDDHYSPAASCLYIAHLDASPYLHADLDDDGTDNGRYYIDITEALSE